MAEPDTNEAKALEAPEYEEKKSKYNQPTVKDLYKIIKNNSEKIPTFTEDELKSTTTERKPTALFVPTAIQEQFDRLPRDVKQKYKEYGEQY